MVRAGGSASRGIGDRGATDPSGGVVGLRERQPAWQLPVGRGLGPHWTSSEQAFPPLGSHSTKDRGQTERNLRDCTEGVFGSGDPMVPVPMVEMDGGSLPVVSQVSGARGHGRGMRPTGRSRLFPQSKINLTDKRENAAVRPLSVEAEEFSLGTGPRNRVSNGGGDFLPSRTGSRVIQCDAAVSTAAEAGATALADIAGTVALVDIAGTSVPAVAEVHSSAVDDEGEPSVVRSDRQRSTVIVDLMEYIYVLEPLEHSVLELSLEGGDSLIVKVAMSDLLENSGVDRVTDVVSGLLLPEPLDHSVRVVPMGVGDGSVADITVLDLLEHSGVGMLAETVSAYFPAVHSEDPRDGGGGPRDHQGIDNTLPDPMKEVERSQPEEGEAIVVGAIG